MDKIKNELKFMLRENEKEKFATNRKINSLPDELQDNPENIIAIHHFLSVESKLNDSLSCIFWINEKIYNLTKILKDYIRI